MSCGGDGSMCVHIQDGNVAEFEGAASRRHKLLWKGDDAGTGEVGVVVKNKLAEKVLEVKRQSMRVSLVMIGR